MDTKEKVEEVIEKIRPAFQADGGDIELVDVKRGKKLQEIQSLVFETSFYLYDASN